LLGQLEDIFVRGVYDFAPAHSAPRILDCGAHVGVAVLHWREQFPLAAITAFEADPEIAGRLRQNLAARGDTLTRIQPAAAWIADGRIGFHRTGSDNGHVSSAATDSVAALDLGAFCREPVDLLKLDIEGAEGRVLAHLHATGALRNIRRLVCEWHEWSSESPALHLALSLLAADGFLYRIAHAGCLGASPCPAFPRIGWPGNHLLIYAWQDSGTTPAP
jgi:FkbM family methyltransferase